MVAPMSGTEVMSGQPPPAGGSQLGRLQRRMGLLRRHHESSLVRFDSGELSLNQQSQQETHKLREKITNAKAKKKRPEPRKDNGFTQVQATKRTNDSEAGTSVEPTKKAKQEPVATTSSAASSSTDVKPPTVTSSATSKSLKAEATALMDDLFGETNDIDYENMLKEHGYDMFREDENGEIPDIGDLSRFIDGTEDADESTTLDGIDVGSSVSTPAPAQSDRQPANSTTDPGGPASSILRTMAERLGGPADAPSGSAVSEGTPLPPYKLPASSAGALAPAVSASARHPAPSAQAVEQPRPTAGEPPPVVSPPMLVPPQQQQQQTAAMTMQQRLKLKRQMMSQQFLHSQQQQQGAMLVQPGTPSPQHPAAQSPLSHVKDEPVAPAPPPAVQQQQPPPQQHQMMPHHQQQLHHQRQLQQQQQLHQQQLQQQHLQQQHQLQQMQQMQQQRLMQQQFAQQQQQHQQQMMPGMMPRPQQLTQQQLMMQHMQQQQMQQQMPAGMGVQRLPSMPANMYANPAAQQRLGAVPQAVAQGMPVPAAAAAGRMMRPMMRPTAGQPMHHPAMMMQHQQPHHLHHQQQLLQQQQQGPLMQPGAAGRGFPGSYHPHQAAVPAADPSEAEYKYSPGELQTMNMMAMSQGSGAPFQ